MVPPVLLLAAYTEYLESSGRARDGGICPMACDFYTTFYTTFLVLTVLYWKKMMEIAFTVQWGPLPLPMP